MTVLVVGMGLSGLSMARHLRAQGCTIAAVDSRPTPPRAELFKELSAAVFCGEDFWRWPAARFGEYEKIAVSPGVDADALPVSEKITGDAALFADSWASAPPSTTLLAVTGTNGKSSVVSLAAHLCRVAGVSAAAIGNIGDALLDALARWRQNGFPRAAAAELSSFQLQTCADFASDAAAVLNVSNDHLDRHGDMARYAAIKQRIYRCCKRAVINLDDEYAAAPGGGDFAVTNFSVRRNADWCLQNGALTGGGCSFALRELSPAVQSQPANALAALALVADLKLAAEKLREGLASYDGLLHRRALLAVIGGVSFVDDSKATNEQAACFALSLLPGKAVLIAGGNGKGQNFSRLAKTAAGRVRRAVLLGRDKEKLAAALAAESTPSSFAETMEDAVRQAAAAAKSGDTVLLSPACSSLDMFADYQQRGERFAAAVGQLEARRAS